MENGEDFWLRYYNGNSWTTVETWARGTDFENNNFYTATVTLSAADYNFANNAQFRFQADASGNRDHIYIDEVIISGITGSGTRGTVDDSSSTLTHIKYLNTDEFNDTSEEDFKMYPNPVSGSTLNIKLIDTPKEATYRIVSVLGREVAKGQLQNSVINVGKLQAGLYVIEINDGEDIMTRKFIKQ